MEIFQLLVSAGLGVFALAVFVALGVSHQLGFRIGLRRAVGSGKEENDTAGFVAGAILALLAFSMAMTLSFAQGRFEDRRSASLVEANAIGTAWLRAGMIGGEHGAAIADQLRAYLALRRDYITAPGDRARIAESNAATSAAQDAIWARMIRIAESRQDAIA
ncbi:MAG: hypothetical protein ACK5PI_03020, partial [Acetobacteraceae bacterium]